MAGMPDWFAKTREMAAIDKYFSLVDAKSEKELIARYTATLTRLAQEPDTYATRSAALSEHMSASQARFSLSGHFAGDWVHARYFDDPGRFGDLGGLFWPSVPSSLVVEHIRDGMELAIFKALGDAVLEQLGVAKSYRAQLWVEERANGIPIDGVLPLAMSWNCVAPTGSDFFDVAALRGPTVVEFAIATPQPYGISMTRRLITSANAGKVAKFAPGRGMPGRSEEAAKPAKGSTSRSRS